MTHFLKQVAAIILFGLMTYVLLYIGFTLIIVMLVVGAFAAIWYVWKFYQLRRALEKAVRDHQGTSFYSHSRQETQHGDVIEGEVIHSHSTVTPIKNDYF